MSEEAKYPEHEKLKARESESLTLSEFLDFLNYEQDIHLGKPHEHSDDCFDIDASDGLRTRRCGLDAGELWQGGVPTNEQLIGLYLGIDPKKLSAEKDAVYQELRANAAKVNG